MNLNTSNPRLRGPDPPIFGHLSLPHHVLQGPQGCGAFLVAPVDLGKPSIVGEGDCEAVLLLFPTLGMPPVGKATLEALDGTGKGGKL